MGKLLSGRVKKASQLGITSDRYKFLSLEQAEPDLGDPIIGPSSVGANPYRGSISDLYVLVTDNTGEGNRYWTTQENITTGGIVSPGSITVRDSGAIIGSVNRVTDINFIGTGVTVTSPASWVGAGSSSVDITISVTDVELPTGPTGAIAYRDSSGLLQGSENLIFDYFNTKVGIGSTSPESTLDVIGNVKISGDTSVASLESNTINVSGVATVGPLNSSSINVSGAATVASLKSNNINVSGVATVGPLNSSSIKSNFLNVTGIVTTNKLIANDIYISNNVGIGSTNPTETLDVNGTLKTNNIIINGTLTAQGTSGLTGQYLKSTGSGLVWEYLPESPENPQTTRVEFTTIATQDQTIFNFEYNPDNIDVFINGIRLNQNDLVANDGSTIVLNTPCFGGEVVDIITFVTIGFIPPENGITVKNNGTILENVNTIDFADNLNVEFSSGIVTVSSVGGGNISLGRFNITQSTGVLGIGSTANITFPDGLSKYILLKVTTSDGAWVTLYTDQQSMFDDSTRDIDTDPLPGSGVIAELVTTSVGVSTQRFTPAVIGYNDDEVVSNNIYAKVQNNSGISTNITITLTITD